MKNNDNAEMGKTGETVVLNGWNQPIKAFPTVEIPLDEYKAFVEFNVKGPTVEIPLQQYEELKEDNMRMQGKIWDLENQIRDLEYKLEGERDRKREIDKHTDIVTKKVADGITENVMNDLLKLSEEQKKELRERWQLKSGVSDKK
ncbi:hypothetical protein E5329_18550 [Petralouisia muris]|uniref:Uncharacterized protein n=1 Tax=Petralouisia muris TaxID=3032872 RepID=A0AC61RSV2_9FIRM|nr:hypothetical protein [Petralouisia muris]TGY93420.1 hypothetical protein E5329_18550 [Petralouisia muris]